MCEEWRADFAAFLAHIGPKPSPDLTLDRVDNDRGYEPNNVRWATRKVQTNNRRNSRPPEQQKQKAKHRPLKVQRPSNTLTANVANAARERVVTIDGVTDTLRGWANRTGLTKETIRYRVNNNYKGKDIITRDDLRLTQRQLRKSNKRQTK